MTTQSRGVPVDYEKWNKELKGYHRRIQTAWTRGNWGLVVRHCKDAKRYFDTILWPDNWPWYKNMYHDAQIKQGINWNAVQDFEDIR